MNSALQITESQTSSGQNAWSFDARGISYYIVEDGDYFEVWTNRKSMAGRGSVRCVKRDEMDKASKTLCAFYSLIN